MCILEYVRPCVLWGSGHTWDSMHVCACMHVTSSMYIRVGACSQIELRASPIHSHPHGLWLVTQGKLLGFLGLAPTAFPRARRQPRNPGSQHHSTTPSSNHWLPLPHRGQDGAPVQNFTFALTDMDGNQRFGFCRLAPSARACLCILRCGRAASKGRWAGGCRTGVQQGVLG